MSDGIEGTGRTGGRAATNGVIRGQFGLSVGHPGTEPPVRGWSWTPLSSVAQLESGHTPSRRHPEYWDGGIPWIGIRDATQNHGRTLTDTFQNVSQQGLDNSSARLLPENTVCLSRTASVGYVVVMGKPMATSQDFVNWVCGPGILYQYLKYILLAEKASLLQFASGTTHQTIYYPEAKAFHVLLPPLPEQRAIAAILGALDDKIELNRKMNETLEQMAQAIFKSWFIDFDGHTEFEDSELGRIPKGWSVGTLNSWAQIIMGSSPSSASYNTIGQGYPLVNGPVEFGPYFPVQSKWTSEPTRLSETGDLIFCVRGSTTGRSVKSDGTYCLGRGVCGIRAKHQRFVDACVSAHLPRLLERATGSVFPNLGTADLNGFKVVSPPNTEVERYEATVSPLLLRVEANHRETCTVADLRDTLLPRLISGQLRVKNIEKPVDQTE